jgi:hypothetical protein
MESHQKGSLKLKCFSPLKILTPPFFRRLLDLFFLFFYAPSLKDLGVLMIFECHTRFRERGNEASIRVPRMFKSHAWQQYDKQMQCY